MKFVSAVAILFGCSFVMILLIIPIFGVDPYSHLWLVLKLDLAGSGLFVVLSRITDKRTESTG